MLWCPACEYGWDRTAGHTCWGCGAEGSVVDLVRECTKSTGFAVEGAKYARAHPGWTLA